MLSSLDRINKDNEKTSKMFGRKVRTYTKELRVEVVAYSEKHSVKNTSNHFKIPMGTVNTWRAKARKDKLKRIPPSDNHPNSKPHGPRESTASMLEDRDTTRTFYNKVSSEKMTTAEQELVELSEKLWKELTVIDDAIKLLRLHKK